MNRIIILIIIAAIVAAGTGAYFVFQKPDVSEINSFDECAKAGYPILETEPRQCKTPDGRTFTEEKSPKCGDGICGPIERQKGICPQDCEQAQGCQEEWQCTSWSDCQNSKQTRTCADKNNCGTTLNKPIENKVCGEKCLENWQCAGWSSCQNGKQTRTCADSNKCGTTTNKPGESQSCEEAKLEISPFGIHGENQYSFDSELTNVGIKVVRYSGGLPSWDKIERTKGNLNWSELDSLLKTTYNNNIEMMLTVLSVNRWDQGGVIQRKFPKDIEGYKNFLKTMVERYDGDGTNDASGSPVVKYYQIENEVDGNFWDDTAAKYAELLEIAYDVVKEANPNAKVVIAGMSEPKVIYSFYTDVLNSLNKKSFDIFDLHWYGNAVDYNTWKGYSFKSIISAIHSKTGNVSVWVSEIGTHGGKDVAGQTGQLLSQQDEKVQASNLIKRYIHYIANGAEIVMWYKMKETHHSPSEPGRANDYFENTGLINNPQNNDGLSHKKLGYYGYKKMIEILNGFSSVQTIQESSGVYIYKFTKNGESIWVAWNDNSGEKQITISGISSGSVKIIEAVPKYDSGKDVSSYSTAFNTETKTVSQNQITLTLKDKPVFVEEK